MVGWTRVGWVREVTRVERVRNYDGDKKGGDNALECDDGVKER